jgi:Helix-turn-helix domain
VVSRDRAGLYGEAAREGAPQARQVADRFHLLQNFRETIERQLGGYEAPIPESHVNPDDSQATLPLLAQSDCASDAVTQTRLMGRGRRAVRRQLFDEIRALFEGGSSVREIAHKLGLGRRRVERWVRRIDLPDRNTMTSTPSTPAYFGVLVERRWAEGITKVRPLFAEIRHRGYTGSFSHLARFLARWRSGEPSLEGDEQEEPAPVRVRTLDPKTGRVISPHRSFRRHLGRRTGMAPRPLRENKNQSDDGYGEDCGCRRAAECKSAVRNGFVEQVAKRRAEGTRQDEGGPEQKDARRAGEVIGRRKE